MNIHEYQGKALLKAAGVPVLEGVHCTTVNEALEAYDSLGSKVVAVKVKSTQVVEERVLCTILKPEKKLCKEE